MEQDIFSFDMVDLTVVSAVSRVIIASWQAVADINRSTS